MVDWLAFTQHLCPYLKGKLFLRMRIKSWNSSICRTKLETWPKDYFKKSEKSHSMKEQAIQKALQSVLSMWVFPKPIKILWYLVWREKKWTSPSSLSLQNNLSQSLFFSQKLMLLYWLSCESNNDPLLGNKGSLTASKKTLPSGVQERSLLTTRTSETQQNIWNGFRQSRYCWYFNEWLISFQQRMTYQLLYL